MKLALGRPTAGIQTLLAACLGLGAFAVVTGGGGILAPPYVEWLFAGDPAQSFLGWHFFRHTSFLQLPLGANPEYGMMLGSSVVFTDSVPLLAFLFKPFSAMLSDDFQYFGIWIAICCVLQAVFACKLLALVTPDKWLPLLGSAFFAVAPAFLWRLHGHYALLGQWVLVAGLYLYLSKRFVPVRWTGLLSMAALIHAYLLVMLSGIWAADLLQRLLRRQASGLRAAVAVVGGCLVTVTVMWLAGYFMIGDGGVRVDESPLFRMNLLSPIDPDAEWSRLLPDQPQGQWDYEGFGYLGLGLLVLALIACYQVIRKPRIPVDLKVVGPLLLLSLCLGVFALSPRIALGRHELWDYGVPSFLAGIGATFRARGRMIWPVYYALYVAVFAVLFHRMRARTVMLLGAGLFVVQNLDSVDVLRRFRSKFSDQRPWSSPLRSALWNEMGQHYKSVIFVLPRNVPPSYIPFALLAASHRIAINAGHFARVSPVAERLAREQVRSAVVANELDPLSLYVFEDDGLWKVAVDQVKAPSAVGILDGFRIVAPRLADCRTCSRDALSTMRVVKH